MKDCIACAEPIKENAKLCKHCGTMQNDERFVYSGFVDAMTPSSTDHVCLSCGKTVPSHIQICESCDATLNAPKLCPNCNVAIKSKPLKNSISAVSGRIRECTKCGFNFFLPATLAKVILEKKTQNFGEADLEFLFFIAWSWQINEFGGSVPALECDYEVAKPLYDQWLESEPEGEKAAESNFKDSWLSIYWPPGAVEGLLPLFEKYAQQPELYFVEFSIEDDDEMFDLELFSYLSLEQLDEKDVREALIDSLKTSKSKKYPQLAKEITNMLTKPDYFNGLI